MSWRHHHGRQSWRHDVGRLNDVVAEGWLVFQLTEDDIADGCRAAAERIARAYALRTAAA